ncbi:MAG: hypothetical protein AMXMBFR34_50210 [Myxococcaceae bacterium]
MVVLAGCDQKHEPPRPKVVGPRVLEPATQTLAFGADCTASGGASCGSGLCLHQLDQYTCTQECGRDQGECPDGWRCEAAHPSSPRRWCVHELQPPMERRE